MSLIEHSSKKGQTPHLFATDETLPEEEQMLESSLGMELTAEVVNTIKSFIALKYGEEAKICSGCLAAVLVNTVVMLHEEALDEEPLEVSKNMFLLFRSFEYEAEKYGKRGILKSIGIDKSNFDKLDKLLSDDD